MKKILQTAVFILALILSVAALVAQEVYKVYVDGLACPFCAYGIEKKLSAIPGVEKIDTDIKTGTVTVTAAEDTALDEAILSKAVEEAGGGLVRAKSSVWRVPHENAPASTDKT